jgi:predicted Zn-dependent peptidase
VFSFLCSYHDTGYLGVYVGTSAESLDEVTSVILEQLRSLVREGLGTEELTRAKNQLKGGILLGMETTEARMSRLAKNEMYFGREVPMSEVTTLIDATTNDDVVALSERLFRPESLGLALLGDLKGRRLDASILA